MVYDNIDYNRQILYYHKTSKNTSKIYDYEKNFLLCHHVCRIDSYFIIVVHMYLKKKHWLELNIASITAGMIVIMLLLVTFSLYIHLVIFVYKKEKIMQQQKYEQQKQFFWCYFVWWAVMFLMQLC